MNAPLLLTAVVVSLSILSAQAVPVMQGSNDAPSKGGQAAPAVPPTASETKKPEVMHSANAKEIVRMQEAGLNAAVIRAYIETARVPYRATAEDIIYLHEHKLPDDLISEWIKKGAQLVALSAQAPARSPDLVASPNAPNGQTAQGYVAQPPATYEAAPQYATPTVVYNDPGYGYSSAYSYSYPYWYPSWYPAPVYLGFSWGFPHAFFGFHRPFFVDRGFHRGFDGRFAGHFRGEFPAHHFASAPPAAFGGHIIGSGGHFAGGHFAGGGHFSGGGHFGGGHHR